MAMAPPRPCTYPRCGRFRCTNPAHQVAAWRSTPVTRIRGRELQRRRAALFAKQPTCAVCRVQPSTIRDHIIPLAEGGRDDETNEQGLCAACSKAKTETESKRGVRRNRS